MNRLKGDMASPRYLLALMATLHFIAFTNGGPLGPLPNVTSADLGLKEGSCALGDVVYKPGDEFPGAGPCERCTCGAGGVQCAQVQCQPRPGCKALHRPDHCCPTYQCECEQEGRVYGNGEKLVDPKDPCRVCYCQGGEVVCRRIACFVRDDCTPRLVPGRCCPEYDNCPLRGVTSLPGVRTVPGTSSVEKMQNVPSPPKEIKQEITIKEITPVSEIPVITNVKIKEILPSPSIEVAEYSSSKSPLIAREATSEKTVSSESTKIDLEVPSVVEIQASTETTLQETIKTADENKGVDDAPPSKISLSTQDSINSDIYPSNGPIIATMGVPAIQSNAPAQTAPITTAKPSVIEDEDPSLFVDHNPAFPPLPDDLSVLSNHGDEIVPEPSADTDHVPIEHAPTPQIIVASVTPSTSTEASTEGILTTTMKFIPETSTATTEKISDPATEATTRKFDILSTKDAPISKENPLLNLRSAIPTDILSVPSEEITGNQEILSTTNSANELLSTVTLTTTPATTIISTTPTVNELFTTVTSTTTVENEHLSIVTIESQNSKSIEDMSIENPAKSKTIESTTTNEPKLSKKLEELSIKASEEISTEEPEIPLDNVSIFEASTLPDLDTTTLKSIEHATSSSSRQEQTTNSISKSNLATEITSQTELSSLPIETSDQNPHDASENVSKDTLDISTSGPITTADKVFSSNSEVITVSKANENNGDIDNGETTEFIVSSFSSSESATDVVDVIKIAGDSDKSASLIDNSHGNKDALTDLIKLVSDVALISDHTDQPATAHSFASTTVADSEELIPVNSGYKSKNSNINQNSITEVPSLKSKSGISTNKQKIVEIEDDESESITDSPPPNDKIEPTTRRPIIDNVSDDKPAIKTDKKDIEIIQSYVPTINRRPTKVVLKDKPQDDAPVTTTDGEPQVQNISTTTSASAETSTPASQGSAESTDITTTPNVLQ